MRVTFLAIFAGLFLTTKAQPGFMLNDNTGDFPIAKILNHTSSSSSFQKFKTKLLIVDFFGTWCVPCIKALPKLSALQDKYKNEINILLVSEEPEEKLESFIKKQTRFHFPLVVDVTREFTKRFKPPSYPYTVVIGINGNVIAIPMQEEIIEQNIQKWLDEQKIPTVGMTTNNIASETVSSIDNNQVVQASTNKLVQLSQDFMYAAKTNDETSSYVRQLQEKRMEDLQETIQSEDEKKAFWINLYNAYTQTALKKNPEQYKSRGKFFGGKQIEVAGTKLSLDDIEHGILRHSKIKWSLGYFNKLFPGKTEKALRVNKLDYRLHFALNCGAKSCPPIAFYNPENIDQQLNLATTAYLKGEAEYDEPTNSIKLPTLMGWFRRDFGGKKGMIELLQQLSIVPAGKRPKIKFKKYDWTLYLQNYKS
jgi:thiol-disulfide isomerase/thioredoxin